MLQAPTEHALWVVAYGEPADNELSITLIEAKVSGEALDTALGPASPVRPVQDSSVYVVAWADYVAFAVRNDSFATPEDGVTRGYGLGTQANSAFYAYVTATTFANDSYPGPLTHWFLNTEWHYFDVISNVPPQVRELFGPEAQKVIDRYV